MKLSSIRRKFAIAALGILALALAATGCSRPTAASTDSMEFFLNMGADTPQYKVMNKLATDYAQQKGITIKVTQASNDYEDQMKVRLASNNIPDLFSTHGWSLLRYSKFLTPLTSQEWSKSVNPALDSAMRDSNGDIYAFPGETDVTGISYNKDVLAKVGIDPASITTWDAFDAAAKAVAAEGITPIFSSGKDQGPAGHIADYLAVDSFTDSQLTQLKDGTFVADPYAKMLERVKGWQQNGWFNKDYSAASLDDMGHALADGKAAFEFYQTAVLGSALSYNPKANVGFIPVPGNVGAKPYLVGGEGVDSFGVSKSSTHQELALGFLAYLADPAQAAQLAQSTGSAPGLTTVKVDFGALQGSYDTYVTSGSTTVKPYFDRVYLPNGMWNTMVATTDSVISGQGTVAAAVDQMSRQYQTLYGQK